MTITHRPARKLLPGRSFLAIAAMLVGTATAREAVILELEGPPAAKLHGAGKASVKAQVARLEKAQQSLLKDAAVVAPKAPVLFRASRVYNGVAFLADPAEARDLASLPGVVQLHRLALVEPSTANSVPFVGAQAVWAGGPGDGFLGQGIRIGIIDTGLDYLHADLGGDGTYSANNTTAIGDSAFFPGPRVVGGWDFVGDAYNANVAANSVPVPDPDPMDCNGHGTHVAGIAAGAGVLPDGTAYAGPWDATTAATTFRIGPGVAPAAELYALRIFGCSGSSSVVIAALDWAMDPNRDGDLSDHLDVVNMSLGSPMGYPESPEAVASDIASEAGIIVVAAAGNSRNTYFIHGVPASSAKAIAVGGSLAPKAIDAQGQPAPGDITADQVYSLSSRGPDSSGFLKPDVSAPASALSARTGTFNQGVTLSGTSMATPHVAGALAILKQKHPDWATSELKALLMNTAHDVYSGGFRTGPGRNGAGRIELRAAAVNSVIAFDTARPDRVSVSFGRHAVAQPEEHARSVTIRNKGAADVTYTLQFDRVTDTAGVTFRLPNPPVVTARAGADTAFAVALTLEPAIMQHSQDTVPPATADRHWMSEEAGYVLMIPDDEGPTLRVPVHVAARPASEMALEEKVLLVDADVPTTFTLHRAGTGVNTGTNRPYDIASLAEGFELQYESGREAQFPTPPARCADLRAVGARRLDPDTIAFGIATWEPYASLNMVSFDIAIDTNGDDTTDYVVSTLTRPEAPTDEFRARITTVSPAGQALGEPLNRWPAYLYDSAIFNSTVVVVPVRLSEIGMAEQPRAFKYQVQASFAGTGDILPVETTPELAFDPTAPGVTFDPLVFDDQPGDTLEVPFSPAGFAANRSLGILMLHLHNAPGNQAETIRIEKIVVRGSGFAVY